MISIKFLLNKKFLNFKNNVLKEKFLYFDLFNDLDRYELAFSYCFYFDNRKQGLYTNLLITDLVNFKSVDKKFNFAVVEYCNYIKSYKLLEVTIDEFLCKRNILAEKIGLTIVSNNDELNFYLSKSFYNGFNLVNLLKSKIDYSKSIDNDMFQNFIKDQTKIHFNHYSKDLLIQKLKEVKLHSSLKIVIENLDKSILVKLKTWNNENIDSGLKNVYIDFSKIIYDKLREIDKNIINSEFVGFSINDGNIKINVL